MTDTAPPALAEQVFPTHWDGPPEPFIRSRDKRVDQLFYGVFNRQAIQVVIGPQGAGRSSILQRLAQRVDGRRTVLWVASRDISDQGALQSLLCRKLEAGDCAPAKPELDTRLEELDRHGRPLLLLVDDADELPAAGRDALEALAGRGADGGVRAVVSCAPAAAEALTADSRYWTPLRLLPLSRQGSEHHLLSRLDAAGVRGHGPFDAATLSEVHTESGGWPGHIDSIGRDLLGELDHLPRARASGRRGGGLATLITLLLVVAVIGAAWHYHAGFRGWVDQTLQTVQRSDSSDTATPAATTPTPTTEPDAPAQAEAAPIAARSQLEPPSPPRTAEATEQQAPAPDTAPTALDSTTAAEQRPPATTPSESEQPSADPAATPPAATADTAAATDDSITEPATDGAPEPTAADSRRESPATEVRLHEEDWILQQDPNAWTLQLLVANAEHHLERLIHSSEVPGDWAWYHIRSDDRDWYTLLYGSFADRKHAAAAAARLKPHVSKPWIRNFAGIQTSINGR